MMKTKARSGQAGQEVVRWRREQLVASGFAPALAARLAEDERYDLHALVDLSEQGCSPELAVRILAPLEGNAA